MPGRTAAIYVAFAFLFSCTNIDQGEKDYEELKMEVDQAVLAFSDSASSLSIDIDSLFLDLASKRFIHKGRLFSGYAYKLFPDGKASLMQTYAAGLKHGVHDLWYQGGKPSSRKLYSYGQLNGTQKSWWPNGQLRDEANYKNGLAHGVQNGWYADGKVHYENYFEFGEEVGLQKSWTPEGILYNNYESRNGKVYGLKKGQDCNEKD